MRSEAAAPTRPAESRPEPPRCPFCGRRKTVRRLDRQRCYCTRCDRIFRA